MTISIYWVYLLLAIAAELVGTVALKLSHGFSNLYYGGATLALYGVSTFFLSKSIVEIPVGVAYAIWAGLGTVAICIIGYLFFEENMTWLKAFAVLMICLGVAILNTTADA